MHFGHGGGVHRNAGQIVAQVDHHAMPAGDGLGAHEAGADDGVDGHGSQFGRVQSVAADRMSTVPR